jgi:hypothetical protein
MKLQPMVDKELHKILDRNVTMEIENRIKEGESHSLAAIANKIDGNQKVWDAEIREIFCCLEDIDLNIKEIIRVVLLKPGSS